jgi:hypothetical protein
MNSSRRDFLLRSGLVSLGGTGLLLSACGGGGGGTGGGGGGREGLLNYGSQELPIKAYGRVPTVRSTSGAVTSTSNVTLPGVASILGSKSTVTPGMTVSLSASLDVAKAVTFVATVPAEITSRISYGIEVLVSDIDETNTTISETGTIHLVIDLPIEMQTKDPNTIVVGAHLTFDDSDGFVALESALSSDKRTVGVDVPASVFDEASGKYLAHLVVAEMPVSRRPGTRPVDYSPNAQKLTVASDAPSGFSFASAPLDRSIEIVSRVGMREATATESYDRKPHVGVDLRADVDTKVLAVADGYLVRLIDFTKVRTGQGNFVSIDHGDVASQYLHLASIDPGILAKVGGRPSGGVFVGGGPRLIPIKAGEVLGIAGNTSTSRIDRHLHLNLVPSGSAWNDSRGLKYVYNPEPLLGGVLDKPQLIAEFLFGYAGKKYQSHDDPNMFMDNPIDELLRIIVDDQQIAYISLHAKDSVFRDVPLPSGSDLLATCSDTNIATVSIDSGRLKLVAKKVGEVKIKVVYTASAQQGIKAYGEVKVKVTYAPYLAQYIKDMCDINGQYRMGSTEVTVAMWREYYEATGEQMPRSPDWGWIDNHPMVNVSWHDIMGTDGKGGYCPWASSVSGVNLSLPTDSQWEFAATGGDGRIYPWGGYGPSTDNGETYPGWDSSKCVNSVSGSRTSTAPVGSLPAGNSPFGCSDMAGNVHEWCLDANPDNPDYHVFMGGSWFEFFPHMFRCAIRYNGGLGRYRTDLGFRLSAGPK